MVSISEYAKNFRTVRECEIIRFKSVENRFNFDRSILNSKLAVIPWITVFTRFPAHVQRGNDLYTAKWFPYRQRAVI